MNPVAKYTLARLALFVAALAVVALAGAPPLVALALAAVVSALLSYVLLRPLRDQVTGQIAQRVQGRLPAEDRTRLERRLDEDAAIEDAADDEARQQSAGKPSAGTPSAGEGQADAEKG